MLKHRNQNIQMFGMTIDIKNMLCQVFDKTHANRCTKKLMFLDVTNMSRYSLCHINYYRITWWWRNSNWEICINKTYCNSHQESISMKQIVAHIKNQGGNINICNNQEYFYMQQWRGPHTIKWCKKCGKDQRNLFQMPASTLQICHATCCYTCVSIASPQTLVRMSQLLTPQRLTSTCT